jgi:hypothetical protein
VGVPEGVENSEDAEGRLVRDGVEGIDIVARQHENIEMQNMKCGSMSVREDVCGFLHAVSVRCRNCREFSVV